MKDARRSEQRATVPAVRRPAHAAAAQWLAAARQAIDAYNVRIEANGVFSEGLRRF